MRMKNLNLIPLFALALLSVTMICWSYIEEGFYTQYIAGSPWLIWSVYVFPWLILLVISYLLYLNIRKK